MKELIKRADGSYSKRGLWDNIRAKAKENKKSGNTPKKPTAEMLKQEKKIKANSKMMGGMLPDVNKMKYGGKMKNC
jgi:hypothetical protein